VGCPRTSDNPARVCGTCAGISQGLLLRGPLRRVAEGRAHDGVRHGLTAARMAMDALRSPREIVNRMTSPLPALLSPLPAALPLVAANGANGAPAARCVVPLAPRRTPGCRDREPVPSQKSHAVGRGGYVWLWPQLSTAAGLVVNPDKTIRSRNPFRRTKAHHTLAPCDVTHSHELASAPTHERPASSGIFSIWREALVQLTGCLWCLSPGGC
jgi:hypothetical protein